MLIHTCMLILNKKFNCIELSDRCIIITEYGICYGWYFMFRYCYHKKQNINKK